MGLPIKCTIAIAVSVIVVGYFVCKLRSEVASLRKDLESLKPEEIEEDAEIQLEEFETVEDGPISGGIESEEAEPVDG